MGCGSSKGQPGADHRKEADDYAERKKIGFKDPGLEKVRKDAIKQKKKLKHVEDPDKLRKQKLETIKAQQKKGTGGNVGGGGGKKGGSGATTAATPAAGGYGGGFSEDAIQAQRNKLKPVKA
jgi:hypothetical protein